MGAAVIDQADAGKLLARGRQRVMAERPLDRAEPPGVRVVEHARAILARAQHSGNSVRRVLAVDPCLRRVGGSAAWQDDAPGSKGLRQRRAGGGLDRDVPAERAACPGVPAAEVLLHVQHVDRRGALADHGDSIYERRRAIPKASAEGARPLFLTGFP
jgi:hypothetical protein